MALGFADEFVQQFRAFDVEEVRLRFAGIFTAHLGHLLGKRVGHSLGDQGLTAARRAVEQHALGRAQRVLPVQLFVQERQFDRIANLLDLSGQATDIAIRDIRHLFEHQILDLGLGDSFEGITGLAVDQQRVTRAQLARLQIVIQGSGHLGRHILGCHQRLGKPDDPLLVSVPDNHRTVSVGKHLTQGADLADRFE